MDNAVHDRELFWIASASCRKYIEVNNYVICGVLAQKRVFLKKRGTFQKGLRHALENVMNCPSALSFLPHDCLRKRKLVGKFASFDHACMTAPLWSL